MEEKKNLGKQLANQQPHHNPNGRAASFDLGDPWVKPEKFQHLNFRLSPDQYSIVVSALDLASSITNSDKSGHNISMIAVEFVATHAGSGGLEELLSILESSLELTIVAVNRKTRKVVYGKDSVEDAA